jgi:uncharacterized integral membrane protein
MAVYLKIAVLIIILFFLTTFGVKNSEPVRLTYYLQLFDTGMPLYLLIYISAAIGILIGMSVGFSKRRALRRKIKTLERETEKLQGRPTRQGADPTQQLKAAD